MVLQERCCGESSAFAARLSLHAVHQWCVLEDLVPARDPERWNRPRPVRRSASSASGASGTASMPPSCSAATNPSACWWWHGPANLRAGQPVVMARKRQSRVHASSTPTWPEWRHGSGPTAPGGNRWRPQEGRNQKGREWETNQRSGGWCSDQPINKAPRNSRSRAGMASICKGRRGSPGSARACRELRSRAPSRSPTSSRAKDQPTAATNRPLRR